MENNEEKQETFIEDRHYKIKCGNEYFVRKKSINRGDYVINNYYIPCIKKMNNRNLTYYKKVRFKSGVELKDNTKILIKSMFEDVQDNPNDKFNPIWHLFVMDFDIVQEPDDVTGAILDYQGNLENTRIDKEREENAFITF